MHDERPITGAEAEAHGALKFECDGCRERFPARCIDHDGRPKTTRRKSTKRAKPEAKTPGNPPFSYSRNPPRGYWGSYDGLITEIRDIRSSLHAPRK